MWWSMQVLTWTLKSISNPKQNSIYEHEWLHIKWDDIILLYHPMSYKLETKCGKASWAHWREGQTDIGPQVWSSLCSRADLHVYFMAYSSEKWCYWAFSQNKSSFILSKFRNIAPSICFSTNWNLRVKPNLHRWQQVHPFFTLPVFPLLPLLACCNEKQKYILEGLLFRWIKSYVSCS